MITLAVLIAKARSTSFFQITLDISIFHIILNRLYKVIANEIHMNLTIQISYNNNNNNNNIFLYF
jgi:hypothetical protein